MWRFKGRDGFGRCILCCWTSHTILAIVIVPMILVTIAARMVGKI